MPDLPHYEVFAIKFGSVERRRSENFLGGDPHDGPMPLDYFLWAIRGAGRTFVIDTGFGEADAIRRNRLRQRSPRSSAVLGPGASQPRSRTASSRCDSPHPEASRSILCGRLTIRGCHG